MKRHILYIVALCLSLCAMAQEKTYVTGRVTDAATGQGIHGASVSAMGVTVLTDEDGNYRLPVTTYTELVQYSAPGYVRGTQPLRGCRTQDVKLLSDALRSEGIAEGGIETTAAFSVDEELAMRLGGDMRATMRGQTAGVGATMFIRGYNSVNLNTQPLIVIDGIIQNSETVESVFEGFYINALASIDVNDIESVEVLKNASSVYGSKGANGAIIITTKRGRSMTTKIDVNMNWGFDFKPKNIQMMDASQYRSYASELLKGTSTGTYNADLFEGYLNDDSDLTSNISYNTYHNNHNWQNDVYQTGFRQYYGLKVEGGDDIAKYSLSVSYAMGRGQVKTTDYDRLGTRFNADIKLASRLTMATGLDFSHTTRNLLDDGLNEYTSPTYLALIKSPLVLPYQYTSDGLSYTTNLSEVDDFGVSNPQSLLDNGVGRYTQYRFGVNMIPKWQISNDWDLSETFAYSMNAVKEHYYSPLTGIASQVQDNGSVYENTVKDQSINQGQLYSDTRAHFGKTWNRRHRLDARAGLRIQTNSYKSNYGEGHNTGSDKIVNLSTSLDGKQTSGLKTTVRNSAMYVGADYNYDNRYGVWAHVTEEACNSFGKNAPEAFRFCGGSWGSFPSGGANWELGNENFLSRARSLNRLNLRADIGLTGNDALDALYRYSYLSAVNYFGSANGLQITNLGNDQLGWEKTRKAGVGIDLAAIDNRLTLSVDYYNNRTSNMLMYHTADVVSGLDSYLTNGGAMRNSGFEFNLGAALVNKKFFKWNAELGVSHYANEVISVPGGSYEASVGLGTVLVSEGQPLGVFYGYRTVAGADGSIVYATEAEAQADGLQTWNDSKSEKLSFHAGDVRFADINGDGVIDESDRVVIGAPNPDITGSLMNRFKIGPVMLEAFFTYSVGGDIYNYQRHLLESGSSLINQSAAMANRWRYEGQVTDIPRATYGDPMGNARFSDRFIEDGSYLRLAQLKLSYQVPVRASFIDGLTVWASASNLYTWTNYLGSDPAVAYGTNPLTQGVDYGILSGGRSFQFGIKLNL